jgi:histidinol phosphatase-like PHP family hydrolase
VPHRWIAQAWSRDGQGVRRSRTPGVAIEIDGDPARQISTTRWRAGTVGRCLFALDSDAHTTHQLRYAETALAHARLAGIPPDRIVNCWSTERLMEWLRQVRLKPDTTWFG